MDFINGDIINMAYDKVVKDYAKQLFFTLNDDGSHKYTYSQIAKLCKDKFKGQDVNRGHDASKMTDMTIIKWARDERDSLGHTWVDIYKSTVGMKQKRAVKEISIALENSEIADQIDDLPKFRYGMAVTAILKGWSYLLSEPIETVKEAQWLVEMGTKEIERLNLVTEVTEDEERAAIFDNLMKLAKRRRELIDEGRDDSYKPELS
jgi:hypothetical protein